MGMPVDDLLGLAPNVLDQLTAELVRQHDDLSPSERALHRIRAWLVE